MTKTANADIAQVLYGDILENEVVLEAIRLCRDFGADAILDIATHLEALAHIEQAANQLIEEPCSMVSAGARPH